MSSLSTSDLDRLLKLLGLLSSDYDGERATAGAMAWRLLKERKLAWSDVFSTAPAARGNPAAERAAYERGVRDGREAERRRASTEDAPPPWRAMRAACLARPAVWNEWEMEFLTGLTRFSRLSEKQFAILAELFERLEPQA